ncbi:poly [ADP-ribose] polymerase tankyrase-1-like isoform X4 [Schistocerca gregaria]|nr:poly [ADP-ribose] polymerase tankyrase-1-like isoform X4 [Schistocerca gregaria]XP_049843332.1 poly [ADP-ribose] polymerase tankyrase-1-like isoform X4 [Schistocerca gregaria]XP_049843333.1 poly [ADP-ribose] polymerase tankyrase-1-like isoform X4 [Schistocerca gregaria]XP_049843334.1 poly [ADP-ribose] polymerase tankyrase-1-like isoform X4 [Schistocerca gregaria]XP_049843335.1 poly [ADP-ribose] polymerase tankyrase-1-like isoform X4 [Schistocerca gregaria]
MSAVNEGLEATVADLGALLDAGEGAVVTLVAGETRLAAHRAVLGARSPVFAATFRHDTAEARRGKVVIRDVEGPVLRQLLVYCYTGEAPQLAGVAPQLLTAADKYGLTALKGRCEQQLVAQLDVHNAAAAAVLAVRHSCPGLVESAVAFIREHSHRVMASQGWADAVLNSPCEVIEIHRLLADLHQESSEPTTQDSEPPAATPPESGHGGTPAAASDAAPPPTDLHPRVHEPTTQDSEPPAATPPESGHGGTPAAASDAAPPPTDLHPRVHEPTTQDSEPPAATPPEVAHGGTPAAAVPPPTDRISRVRNLSAKEKSSRLLQAAKDGALEDLRALLAVGADTGFRDRYGWRALHYSAYRGDVQAVRSLLNSGAEVDARTLLRATPLHLAAVNNHAAVVAALAASGADVDARAAAGLTPLHDAAAHGNAEAATALLRVGANKGARAHNGLTPLHAALVNNKQQLIDILK